MGLGFIWAPASALLAEIGEDSGMELSLAFALFNFTWALCQVLGGAGGAGIANLTSDAVPYMTAFALCLATLVAILARRNDDLVGGALRSVDPA